MRDMLWMIVSFIAYFVILKIGKGAMGIRYYSQITALIPLHIKLLRTPGVRRLFVQ